MLPTYSSSRFPTFQLVDPNGRCKENGINKSKREKHQLSQVLSSLYENMYTVSVTAYNVIHFVSFSTIFGICTVVGLKGILVKARESVYFSFNKCPS
jgi:hypothetical protein